MRAAQAAKRPSPTGRNQWWPHLWPLVAPFVAPVCAERLDVRLPHRRNRDALAQRVEDFQDAPALAPVGVGHVVGHHRHVPAAQPMLRQVAGQRGALVKGDSHGCFLKGSVAVIENLRVTLAADTPAAGA